LVGVPINRTLTVSNAGEQPLSVTGVSSSDPHFTTSTTVPFSIQPGSQQSLTVTYLPTTVSTDQGTLTLTSNAGAKGVPMIGAGLSQPPPGRILIAVGGQAPGDQLGVSASGAGDVNRDGYDDMIVGSWTSDANGDDAGRAYVFLGGANP